MSKLVRVLAAAAPLLLGACPEERPGAERKIPGERFPPAEPVRAPAGTATPPPMFKRPGAVTPGPSPGPSEPVPGAVAQPAPLAQPAPSATPAPERR